MDVKLTWIDYSANRSTGSITGANFTSFTVEEVMPDCWRLTSHLPRPSHGVGKAETFHRTVADAKRAAGPYASAFMESMGGVVSNHPAIRCIDNVRQLAFPYQLCHDRACAFFGGDSVHEDVMVEKVGKDGWAISREDGRLLHRTARTWTLPDSSFIGPAGVERMRARGFAVPAEGEVVEFVWLAEFLWPLEEALEQVQFMHCG